ncbi:putative bifunctional diguanylate cyclase/phosphodiesterase [Spongisporangium articulatum]|uniref:Bifunctional diguanylate cyclase/phosphodiesterase n=1 Tax=Spongisporangium articulatum TaxID=3362603 RepID=A0ABW8AVD6_9ACTN
MRFVGLGRRRPARLAVWLTALVLVPLTAIGLQLYVSAAGRSEARGQARVVEVSTSHLVKVVALGAAVARERIPTTIVLANLGKVDSREVGQAIGLDVDRFLSESQAATDAALATLPDDAWVAPVRARTEAARAAMKGPLTRARSNIALDGLWEAQKVVQTQVLSEIDDMQQSVDALAVTGSAISALRRDLESLRQAYELVVAFANEGASVFALGDVAVATKFPAIDPNSYVTSPRLAYVTANALYRSYSNQLRLSSAGAIAKKFTEVDNSGDARLIGVFFDRLGKRWASKSFDGVAPRSDLAGTNLLTRAFLSIGLRHFDSLKGLVQVAGQQVSGDARAIRTQADDAYRQIWFVMLAAAFGALAGVGLLTRVVTRPLAQVAARARRIADGDLEPVTATGGPREVHDVSSAFDEMAQNLILLQQQADALAAGETRHESLQKTVPGAMGRAVQASVQRLSQSLDARRQLEDQLRYESTHDGLTGLLNRASALVALEHGLARVNRTAGGLGVIHVDLDRLGLINDLGGPGAGDAVLKHVATSISTTVRTGDIVARLDSDEFVIITETDSVDVLMELARRILDRLGELTLTELAPLNATRLRDAGLPPGVGASAGVVVAFDGLQDATALLRDAADAIRSAKRKGGGHIELLDDELRRLVELRHKVHDGLRQALDDADLRLQYQPIVDTAGRTAGVEALVRWTSRELGVVAPDVFVEAAESSELVLELDRWVLAEALRQLTAWDAAGQLPGIYMSVNISGRHLGSNRLVPDVKAALAKAGVAPERLLIEITETVLLSDLSDAAAELTELRELGVRIAVDDFGTGYTSIAHLTHLPVDIVKIDRSFVVGMAQERGKALLGSLVEMAKALNLKTVAEGVETEEELAVLHELGCDLIQGYLLGRPSDPELLGDRVTPASQPA